MRVTGSSNSAKPFAGVFALLTCLLLVLSVSAQVSLDPPRENKPVARLLDEFGKVVDCDFRGRLDLFLATLANEPDSQGYIINYIGTDLLPAARNAFARDKYIANHIGFRRFDASRITILAGGFRPETVTELWIIPPGAAPPTPSRTVPAPDLPSDSTFLYAKNDLGFEGVYGALTDLILESVKAKEKAELMELMEPSETENDDAESSVAAAEFVDPRTEEQKVEEWFQWANIGIARLLSARPGSSGLLIYYADSQRYDLGKLDLFVKRGRDLLAENGPIRASRIKVLFGGYREYPQVEFWVIPKNGKRPLPTPETSIPD